MSPRARLVLLAHPDGDGGVDHVSVVVEDLQIRPVRDQTPVLESVEVLAEALPRVR